METSISCPVCSREIGEKLYRTVHTSPYDGTEYKLYSCRPCSLDFWHPMKLVPQFYEQARLGIYDELHRGLTRLPPHCLGFFDSMPVTEGNLLDVGCGDGIFLNTVATNARYRFNVFGLDLDAASIATARSRYGLTDVYAKPLDAFRRFASEHDLSFDVITFFDVLEHQDNPRSFIENVRALLSPAGYIAGSVPNANRLFAQRDRKISDIDFPPHHFLYFNESSLRSLLSQEGFRHITVMPVRLGLKDMTALVENLCLGRISRIIRRRTAKTGAALPQSAPEASVKKHQGVQAHMRRLRNAFFSPLSAALLHAYNRRGPQLYFQARLPQTVGDEGKN